MCAPDICICTCRVSTLDHNAVDARNHHRLQSGVVQVLERTPCNIGLDSVRLNNQLLKDNWTPQCFTRGNIHSQHFVEGTFQHSTIKLTVFESVVCSDCSGWGWPQDLSLECFAEAAAALLCAGWESDAPAAPLTRLRWLPVRNSAISSMKFAGTNPFLPRTCKQRRQKLQQRNRLKA